ncbi:MAG: hypothetical protein ACKO23_05460, partial [Gemmataceae bacterium]
AQKGRTWAGPLGRLADRVVYHRGFVECVHVLTQTLIDHPAEIFHLHPIRMVRLQFVASSQVTDLANQESLRRLKVLAAPGNYRHAGSRILFPSPNLQDLEGLAIPDTPIGERGLAELLSDASMRKLTHLNLGATGIGQAGINRLAGSSLMNNLVALDIRGNNLNEDALQALNDFSEARSLRRLGFWFNQLGDNGLIRFTEMGLFSRLRHLSIGNNQITSRGLHHLAQVPALRNLQTIWLGVDPYGSEGVEALVRSPHLSPDVHLGIWLNEDIPEQTRNLAREILGNRVLFEEPGEHWDRDPVVGWPAWHAEDEYRENITGPGRT